MLGETVRLLSLVGYDAPGRLARETLRGRGIDDRIVLAQAAETAQSAILYDGDGRRQIHVDLKNVQEQVYPTALFDEAAKGCRLAVLCNINFSRLLLEIALSPADQTGLIGQVLTYTLTITNLEATARSYDLSSSGLAEVSLQASICIPASSSADLEFTARPAMPGPNPFSITAQVAATGSAATADAAATGVGFTSVAVSLEPATVPAGPASSAVLTATVSNLGSVADVYDLTVDAPAGWTTELTANGVPVSQVALAAGAFNRASFHLVVTPPFGATPGAYPVTVSALSQTDLPGAPAQAEDTATVQVGTRGLQVEFISGPATLLPSQAGVWQVRVTNRGSVPDSYTLSVLGGFSGASQFTPAAVNLGAGASQVVQLSAGPLPFALPGAVLLTASARSTGNSAIVGEAATTVTFGGQEAVQVGWQPVSQTISQTLEATYMLLITNTGNIETTYLFDVAAPNLQVTAQEMEQLSIPPHMTAANLVTLRASQAGVFPFSGQASSASGPASDTAGATLIVVCPGDADVDNDGQVTVLDITAVAERWNAFGAGNYSFVHDLNCDGVIDIVDIQGAAGGVRDVGSEMQRCQLLGKVGISAPLVGRASEPQSVLARPNARSAAVPRLASVRSSMGCRWRDQVACTGPAVCGRCAERPLVGCAAHGRCHGCS
jgi:hypothetical protein